MYNPLPKSNIIEWWVWDDLEDSCPDREYDYHRIFHWRSQSETMMGLGEVKRRWPLQEWNEQDIKRTK